MLFNTQYKADFLKGDLGSYAVSATAFDICCLASNNINKGMKLFYNEQSEWSSKSLDNFSHQSFLAQGWGMTENKKQKENKQKVFQEGETYK